jgi:hypothetical protein
VYVGAVERSELFEVMQTGQTMLRLTDDDLDGLRGELADVSTHDGPLAVAAKPI